MHLSTDRILTTHVGSLPRPDDLAAALLAKEKGEGNDPAAFEAVVARSVADAVKRQVAVGIDVVSDGEMSKIAYSTYIQERLSGFSGHRPRKPNLDVAPFPRLREKMARITGEQPFKRAVCTAPIAVVNREPLRRDLANFGAALKGQHMTDAFLNAASPGVITVFQSNDYYPSQEAYLGALSDAMREEYEAIVGAGFLLQVDAPDLAMARHTTFQDLPEAEFLAQAQLQVEALNAALVNVPKEKVRMHVCWGNYEGPHTHDIDVAKVLPLILRSKIGAVSFEAANSRHSHEWKAWRDADLPDDLVLLPGVVDTTSNFVEHPELVAQRIETFADIVGRERVIASSDCGFGTFAGFGKLDPDVSYLKLEALAEGARIASARLW
ncbi:MAG: cobalamin-independent methionine synthase II family protein [Chloroflexota bacterium]